MLVPSTPAIQGFLKLNQMGAEFEMVIYQFGILYLQALVYGVLAFTIIKYKREIKPLWSESP
jgi:ABC-2 type transport system permease protein